jgi:hypothetical protein
VDSIVLKKNFKSSKNSNRIQKNGQILFQNPVFKPISGGKSMKDIHNLIGHKCCLWLISAFNFFIVHQFIELKQLFM